MRQCIGIRYQNVMSVGASPIRASTREHAPSFFHCAVRLQARSGGRVDERDAIESFERRILDVWRLQARSLGAIAIFERRILGVRAQLVPEDGFCFGRNGLL
jgi:hypothetical protein